MRRTIAQSALVFASVLLIIALAGCGGSGKKAAPPAPAPMPVTLDLPEGHDLETVVIAAGDSETIEAGGNRYTLSCPGEEACSITVAEDGAATSTGGTPMLSGPTVIMVELAGLPGGHGLATGEIAAGRSSTRYDAGRRIVVTCPGGEDAAACSLTVAADGDVTYAATGGAPMVRVTTNELVWQANNGPAGSSDGAHALGFARRLVAQATPLGSTTSYEATGLGEGNMQTTLAALPAVTPSMEWTRGASPTLGLTLGSTTFSSLDGSSLPMNSGRLSVDSGSVIPSLGRGWNGAALSKDLSEVNGKTIRGVVYTNAEEPTGGTADTDYQVLGSWLVLPNDAAAATAGSYNLGVFQFASSARLPETNLDGNAGDITFEGQATGVYTTGAYTGTGASRRVTSAEVGSFTADVELVGAFGASAAADTFTGVTGTVNSFTDANGKSLGWTMSLQATGSDTGGASNTDEVFTGNTVLETTGAQSATGNWGVGFYWNTQRTPSAGLGLAGGTFDASTATSEDSLLHVVGAFAAERQ